MYQAEQPKGWVEILFHTAKTTPNPSSFSELDESDYVMLGSPIPLQELDSPYEVYQILYEKQLQAQPRDVRSFDAINIVHLGAPRQTMIVVSPQQQHAFLSNFKTKNGAKGRVEIWPQFPHGLMQMPQPFSQFRGREKQ